MAKCNTLAEWLAHEQARVEELVLEVEDPVLGRVPLVGPPVRIEAASGERRPGRRHGAEQGALGGHRIVDLSSFWAGPLAARLLAELGADVVKVEPPGGEGWFQLMPVLPNIYVDGNRSKRGLVLDLKTAEDRARLLDLVAASDVVVENAMAGAWERLGLDEAQLRAVNPSLVYARAKGFGVTGPLAARPSFDYVVQAATGMEMTQGGGGRPVPVNFTANDYGTGLLLAAGIVLALLGRARGVAVTGGRRLVGLDGDRCSSPRTWRRWRRRVRCRTRWATDLGGPVGGVPSVSSQGRVGDGVLRDGRAAGGAGAGAGRSVRRSTAVGRRVWRRRSGRSRWTACWRALRDEGVPAAVSVHPSRGARRPPGRGARAVAPLPPSGGGALRAGRASHCRCRWTRRR